MSSAKFAVGTSVLVLALGYQIALGAAPSAAKGPARIPVRVADTSGAATSSADAELVLKGKELFAANCAVCHGDSAQGKIGPRIVGKQVSDIDHALATVSLMSSLKAQITEDQRRAIAAYLDSL